VRDLQEDDVVRRRSPLVVWFIPLIIGLVGLNRVMQSPNYGLYRAVDIVQLLGSGVCFGATMVGLIFMLRGPRRDT
jgi:hypothetical protein